MNTEWSKEFPAAITICDKEGIILEMNDKSAVTFADDGGLGLIGKNLFGCHSPESVNKIKEILSGKKANIYTIEKKGKKKLIYQSPWYKDGELKGLVEFTVEIPMKMPHFVRE
jgi:DUF438 domain-containing protein